MALNEGLLKRLIETPGVPGREEKQREIAREELGSLTDEVSTDALGSVIGTKRGSGDARVMVAAHTDEIGYLVKYIDDKGFLRLQTLGGHDPANMVSQRVLVTTSDGEVLRGALQPARKPPHIATAEDKKPPKTDEFFVDLGMDADTVKEKVRIGDFVVMDRTLEKVGDNFIGKAMDDRIGVFVMYEALRALGDHTATVFAVATSQEEVGLRGAEASGSALEPTVVVALDVTLAMDVPGGGTRTPSPSWARASPSRSWTATPSPTRSSWTTCAPSPNARTSPTRWRYSRRAAPTPAASSACTAASRPSRSPSPAATSTPRTRWSAKPTWRPP